MRDAGTRFSRCPRAGMMGGQIVFASASHLAKWSDLSKET
jgi:hypothetical protein